jgi:hypothetical protein
VSRSKSHHAHDAIVGLRHLHAAEDALERLSWPASLAWLAAREPGLAAHIMDTARAMAGRLALDHGLPRQAARMFEMEIGALAFRVHFAYGVAAFELYGKLMEGSPLGRMIAEMDAPPPISEPKAEDEGEGATHGT